DLSESQKSELKEILTDIAARAKEMRPDRETRHRELANLIRQDTIDRETVDMMITAKFDQMRELADNAASRLIAFHATLSPEQREKIAEHVEEHTAADRGFFRQ
ncbi:MAG: periplasmic heavy metal sensor, partial [Desulfobacterales bacterium]